MKIMVRDAAGVRALEEGFASELELQEFLRDYAELIPVDEIGVGTPHLLCIGFEVHVASGYQDVLYADHSGLLTIVETKLKKNPEAKREVVGQILEYAAQASAWTGADVERKANEFLTNDKNCPKEYSQVTLRRALEMFLERHPPEDQGDFSYEGFLEAVSSNLAQGRIRLIIAVDDPPEALLRTVEFVNRFSKHFEMYLLQLKRFKDLTTDLDIFVPAIFGRISQRPSSLRGPSIAWDRERFFAQASQSASPEAVRVLNSLCDFAGQKGRVVWGSGRSQATFRFQVNLSDGSKGDLFSANGNGKLEIAFSPLLKHITEGMLDNYRARLRQVGSIPEEVLSSQEWKQFDAALLADGDGLSKFQEAVQGFASELERADAGAVE